LQILTERSYHRSQISTLYPPPGTAGVRGGRTEWKPLRLNIIQTRSEMMRVDRAHVHDTPRSCGTVFVMPPLPNEHHETIEGSRTMRNRPYPVLKCSARKGV